MEKTLQFIKPEYKKMGVYELTLNPKNIRKISKKGFTRLKNKILENVYEPIKVWKQGNLVLSGNQRLSVMRHLIEEGGYDIEGVEVAIYDVDEKTAKFIELSDNEHEGEYDFEKMLEELEEIEEFGLKDIFGPDVIKKLDAQMGNVVKEMDDTPEIVFDENTIEEVAHGDIIISHVPKEEMQEYYSVVDRIKKKTKIVNEWTILKIVMREIAKQDDSSIEDLMGNL